MTITETSDAELVSRARSGELDAYEALVQRYQQLAMRVAMLILRNAADAEDVVQEAFYKAYVALPRVTPTAFRPWLLSIVANESRNLLKAEQRRLGRDTAVEAWTQGPALDTEGAVLASEQRVVILQALDRLREEDRLAIAYRYFFDLSETEMVDALGWRRGTVKSRLSRALVRFRQELGQLALVPIGAGGAFSQAAGQLAGASEAELAHGLAAVGPSVAQVSVADISSAVIARLSAAAPSPEPQGSSPATMVGSLVAIAVLAILSAFVTTRPPPAPEVVPPPPPPPTAVVTAVAPTVAPPGERSVAVFGADLDDAQRAEVGQLLGLGPDVPSVTLPRDEVLSTLNAAGAPAAPSDRVVSSVAMTCSAAAPGIRVQTEHLTGLAPLTFATALLAAGVSDASVTAVAPAAEPVSGESALVGMLKAAGECSGREDHTAARVSLGFEVMRVAQLVSRAGDDQMLAATVLSDVVRAIVTGQVTDTASIAAALDAAAQHGSMNLDPALRDEAAAALLPLVGQDYGAFARGYQVHSTPDSAHLTP